MPHAYVGCRWYCGDDGADDGADDGVDGGGGIAIITSAFAGECPMLPSLQQYCR
jgi:hypothetical protein